MSAVADPRGNAPSPEARAVGGREPTPADLTRFLFGVGSWFASFGLHGVLFASLLVVELQESELRVGLAQSAIMIPAVLLMLAGGVVADRGDRRRLLIGLHAAAAVLAVSLSAALFSGWLSYSLLIAYAVSMGTVQAFMNPARDAFLSDVAGEDLARPVAMVNLTQWGSQACGALFGGLSRFAGVPVFFAIQSVVLSVGAFAIRRIPPCEPRPAQPTPTLGDLLEGVREVMRTPDLRLAWLLVCAVGVLFIGPFMVVFPLMVRDVYLRGAAEIAFVSTAFPLGTISGSIVVIRMGGLGDLMKSQCAALALGASVLITISFGLPFWGMIAAVYVWGTGAAVFMIAGRTLFQQRASAANRGRVLATYTMGFMGAAGMFGAPLAGILSSSFGPQRALAILGATMLVLVAFVVLRRFVAERSPEEGA